MIYNLMKHLKIIFILIATSSCAGYHFTDNRNPFAKYGIKSVSVPVFVNRSILKFATGPITREFIETLSDFSGLRVEVGENMESDAILIGILDSAEKKRDVFKSSGELFTGGSLKKSIGKRQQFYLPRSTSYSASLRLVLIKKAVKSDLKLAKSKFAQFMNNNPKVIFNEVISVSSSYSHALSGDKGPDSGNVVNYTKTDRLYLNSLNSMAESAANNFRELIVNAF